NRLAHRQHPVSVGARRHRPAPGRVAGDDRTWHHDAERADQKLGANMAASAARPFCQPAQLVTQNNLAYAVVDKHPVTPGHALIVPYRQVADYFDTTQA